MEYEKIRETLDPLLRKTGVGEVEVKVRMGAFANDEEQSVICHSSALALQRITGNGKTKDCLVVIGVNRYDIHDVVSIERVPIEPSVINL